VKLARVHIHELQSRFPQVSGKTVLFDRAGLVVRE
jgi:hypothetical protein